MIATTHEPALRDPDRYAQAIAILTREELSPHERRLFNSLVGVTAAALTFSVAWAVAVIRAPQIQAYFLWPATVAYAALLPISIRSLPLLRRVQIVRRREREFSLNRPLKRLARRQRGYFLLNVLNGFWLLLGLAALFWALIGLSVWPDANFIGRLGVVNLFALALSCALILPVRRVRQKMATLASLQTAVSSAENGELEDVYYDGLVCLERIHIADEQEKAVEDSIDDGSPAVRITDAFVRRCEELDETGSAAVFETIQRVLATSDSLNEREGTEPVPDLPLSIAFARDPERNEITFTALVRRDDRAGSSDAR